MSLRHVLVTSVTLALAVGLGCDKKEEAKPAPVPEAAPKAEEPKAEAPKEEPKVEEPKAEEPKAEEPKAEEPKAEEAAAAAPASPGYAMAVPIAADKAEAWNALVAELTGAKKADAQASLKRRGIKAEHVFTQPMPDGKGVLAIAYFETDDPKKMMDVFMTSTEPFDVWLRGQFEALTGMKLDPANPMPMNEVGHNFVIPGVEATKFYALAAPILPGQEERHAKLIETIKGEKWAEFEAADKKAGIAWEGGWKQVTPQGTWYIVVMKTDDAAKAMAPPETDFEKWFMGEIEAIHGFKMDPANPMPLNTLALDITAE